MHPRLNPYHTAAELMKAMISLEESVRAGGLEASLQELVKTRASQINGCAYCIHMHSTEARKHGETPERLLLLNAWRDSPLYTDRQHAALGWTEAVTLVAQTHAPDAAYNALAAEFDQREITALTVLIATINSWNRIGISFRLVHPIHAVVAA
jgi:AhpD family alkylhydroperoxidase